MPEEAVRNFGIKVAEAMDVLKSSQVFFILQQAYPEYADDWEWADFQELILAPARFSLAFTCFLPM